MSTEELSIARGANFILARDYVLSAHGQPLLDRVLARLAPDHRRVWDGPLMLIGSYDFAAFKAFAASLAAETRADGDHVLASMYAFIADRSLNSLYKVFFRMANPAFVIGNFPRLWSRFFTKGEVLVPAAGRERAELRFRVPEIFLGWLGPACQGYSAKAVELAGGRDARVRETARRALGAGVWEVSYDVAWREG